VPQRLMVADTVRYAEKKRHLTTLAEFIEDGKITPVIDRHYPFAQLPAAVGYQEQGHVPGKVVVAV